MSCCDQDTPKKKQLLVYTHTTQEPSSSETVNTPTVKSETFTFSYPRKIKYYSKYPIILKIRQDKNVKGLLTSGLQQVTIF